MAGEPPEGRDWKPVHGYSQVVTWDGGAVAKRFSPDTAGRCAVEAAVLNALAGVIPVAAVMPSDDPCTLRVAWVPGCLGQQWVADRGSTRETRHVAFLAACGAIVRRIQEVDIASIPELPGDGEVLVHGDFAPYNVIVDAQSGVIQAVIDWELAHAGRPVVDLAWMEWNMRIWYSPSVESMTAMYDAYGELPDWTERHAAMLERCRPHLERAEADGPADLRDRWADHVARTESFTELIGA